MFRRQFQERSAGHGIRQFLLQKCLIVRELSAQADSDLPFQIILRVVHDPGPAKDDYAADIQCPVTFFTEALVIYTVYVP